MALDPTSFMLGFVIGGLATACALALVAWTERMRA